MKLHDLLKQRFEVCKAFTEPHHEEVKKSVKDYKADPVSPNDFINIDYVQTVNSRYQFIIPLVFTNHENMLASMFDRTPDLIITGKGANDEEKEEKINASYEYLVDKLDLEGFLTESAWWFILTGFASAHLNYDQKLSEVPVIDEEIGEQVIDPITGQPSMRTVYDYDDPIVSTGSPLKEFWSPESVYSIEGDKVPYYFKTELMGEEEVKNRWNKKVVADATLEVPGKKFDEKVTDIKRVQVYFYYGEIPQENKGEVKEWEYGESYYIVYTQKEILFKDKLPGKMCRLVKWYGPPNEFFGFGIAKVLRPFQKEKSIRRSQQIRYADVAAYPKLALKQEKKIDAAAWVDPRENVVALYEDEPPQYVSPPDLSNVLTLTEQAADRDAQQASGMIDLSQGSQTSSTVKTATGQTIFAEAAERRMKLAKKTFVRYYRSVVIGLLKLAKENWSETKVLSITDEDGNPKEIEVSGADLGDVDFDTDIDIDGESLSVNRDVIRQQAIELYNITKDDQLIERKKIFKDLMKEGFNKKDPDSYIKESEIAPGTPLVNPETGEQFVIDEGGDIISQQGQDQLSNPTGGGQDIPASQAGILAEPYK